MRLQSGILHIEKSSRTLENKLHDMVSLYENKFGILPNCVHLHPEMLEIPVDYVVIEHSGPNNCLLCIVQDKSIPKHGYWVGIADE